MFIELSSLGLEIHAVFYSLTGIAQHMQDKRLGSPGPSPQQGSSGSPQAPTRPLSALFSVQIFTASNSGKSIANYWYFPMKPSPGYKG